MPYTRCKEVFYFDELSDKAKEQARDWYRQGFDYDRLEETLRDFNRWIYTSLRDEYEYLTADEQVDESIRENEYEFTEDGNRYIY